MPQPGLAGGRRGVDDAAAVLARSALFGGLDGAGLARAAGACTWRSYARGEVLCVQGEPGTSLFVIASGLVKVVFTAEQGDEMLLATLGPAHTFGEVAVLDGGPRSASVIAVEPTAALTLARVALLDLMRANPAVLDGLLVALGGMVRRLTEQTGDLAFLGLAPRLAKVLVRLTDSARTDQGVRQPGLRAYPPAQVTLTQSDLAGMVGASRQAVNRALQSLVLQGVIDIDGRRIVARDLVALRRLAES